MKAICVFFAFLLLPGTMPAQARGQEPSSAGNMNLAAEVNALREALQETQKQVADQQREIEALKAQPKSGQATSSANRLSPMEGETSPPNSASPSLQPASAYSATIIAQQPIQQNQEKAKSEEPLGSIKIGDAILTLGGFVDFENIFRTTNTQSNIATNFGGIPYNN
ncbi:MAG TPA: hypothetical protein VMS18_00045, partial [Candidatus Binatia bacterium]|nr:hypothetical protein [Candidatus Binatia bacterium]